MAKQKDKFLKGAVENGLTPERAQDLFKLIEPFAAYGSKGDSSIFASFASCNFAAKPSIGLTSP
jgi:DNA polymerase-3 subunit alpha